MLNRSQNRNSYAHGRPAPRTASGKPRNITDDVTWTRVVEPAEVYRVVYLKDGVRTDRNISLSKIGHSGENVYLGVTEQGKFKTMRADRIVEVVQLSHGHTCSIVVWPQYSTVLPPFPVEKAVFKMPAVAAHSRRTWTVDLNRYTCTCPEKRIRSARGYAPGQLGFCCPHVARAIVENLPTDAPQSWTAELRAFLSDARRTHLDNLISLKEQG